jgi:hypothetical protein
MTTRTLRLVLAAAAAGTLIGWAIPVRAADDLDRIKQKPALFQMASQYLVPVQTPLENTARQIGFDKATRDVLQSAPECRRLRIGDYALPSVCYDPALSPSGVDLGTEACPFRSAWIDEINGSPLPVSGGVGDVVGPASSTDHALARYDLTTGKLLQNSVALLSDAGILTGLTGLTTSGTMTLDGTLTSSGANDLDFNVPTGQLFVWNINSAPMLVMGSNYLGPNGENMALGRAAVGWTGLFLGETGAGTDTVHVVAPASLGAPIQVVLPSSAGTLALTSDIPAAYTDEQAQDAVGAMVNTTLVYTDGTPLLAVNPDLSIDSITLADLTSGRVPIVGTAGLLGDDSDLTFSGSTLTATNYAGGSINLTKTGSAGTLATDEVALFSRVDTGHSAAARINSSSTGTASIRLGQSIFTPYGGMDRLSAGTGYRLRLFPDLTLGTSAMYIIMDTDADRISFGNNAATDILRLDGATGYADRYAGVTLDGVGFPHIVAEVNATAQAAAIGTTTLYTPPSTGFYRISVYLQTTTAATSSSTMGPTTLGYNDGDGNVAQSNIIPQSGTGGAFGAAGTTANSTTGKQQGSYVFYARTGVAITYAIGYASSGATAMQYAYHVKLERL